jgi:hypothetical protein
MYAKQLIYVVIMHTKKAISPLLFYPLCLGFFFLDLGAFILFEKPLLLSLLCFYILQLGRPISWPRIIFGCTLASLEFLLFYGRFGLNLVYLVPATFVGIKMNHNLYDSRWQYYLLLAVCILLQKGALEPFILGIQSSIPYTLSTLFANLVMMWVINLFL